MHYPWWYVHSLTSPMLIALVATLHIFASLYAVGGGLFLAEEVGYAYKVGNKDLLTYLHSHTFFFILLTVVYGAITGVGIWWTIGLASPLATESLIHIFVFGWAMEYVFFVLEVVSAFIFFYYWGKLKPEVHTKIGWIYGISAYMSLVLITAITSFQLDIGTWTPGQSMWIAFFNPQTFPQIIARSGASLLLASLYVYLHAAFKLKNNKQLLALVETRAARWSMAGAVLVTIGGVWWLLNLPESAKASLAGASALIILTALIFAATVVVFLMLYFGSYRRPGWVNQGFAILYFIVGIAATSTGEFIREGVRKPYIIYNFVTGNNVLVSEIPKLQQTGYLNGGTWTRAFMKAHYPQVVDSSGNVDSPKLLSLPESDQLAVGRVLFQYHCNDCHSAEGFSAVAELTRGWSEDMIQTVVTHLDKAHFFMPPWCGTKEESIVLSRYLASISFHSPAGMKFSSAPPGNSKDMTASSGRREP